MTANATALRIENSEEDVDAAWAIISQLAPDDLGSWMVETQLEVQQLPAQLTVVPAVAPAAIATVVATVVPTAAAQPVAIPPPESKPAAAKGGKRKKLEPVPGEKLSRRQSNTLCEARRREKLNDAIKELAGLLHMPYKSTNKDKCTVLSQVAAVLRQRKAVNQTLTQLKQMIESHSVAAPLSGCTPWQGTAGLFVLSLQMQVLHVNPWLWRTLGYSSAGPGFGYAMSFIHQDFAGQVYEDIAKLLSLEVDKIQHHERLKCKDGSFRWFLCAAAVGQLNSDKVIYGVVVEADANPAYDLSGANLQKTIDKVM